MFSTERLQCAMCAAQTAHPAWASICETYGTDPQFARELIASGVSLTAAVWLLHEAYVGSQMRNEPIATGLDGVRRKLAAHAMGSMRGAAA